MDINVKKNNGMTPFHYACRKGNYIVFKMLIKKGAFPYSETNQGYNSLHFACASDSILIVKYLIEIL